MEILFSQLLEGQFQTLICQYLGKRKLIPKFVYKDHFLYDAKKVHFLPFEHMIPEKDKLLSQWVI